MPILLLRTPYGTGDLNPARMAACAPRAHRRGLHHRRCRTFADDSNRRGTSSCSGSRARARTRRPSTRAPTPTTPSNGCSPTCPVTMDGSAWRARATARGSRSWRMLDPHPALKAVVSQASPADMWLGDDFHHNGSFRLSYGLEYVYRMESSKEIANPSALIDTYDTYEWYLRARTAGERQRQVLPRKASDLERFRQTSGLRRVLEAAGVCAMADAGDRADAERRRLVGPGRLLRPAEDLRAAGEARFVTPELPGGGTVESRWLVSRRRPETWSRGFRKRDVVTLPQERAGPVPGALPQGHRQARP